MRFTVTNMLALLTTLSLTGSGCSFVLVRPAPADHKDRPFFSCTNSHLAPGLDATLGGLMLLGMVGDVNDNGWSQDSAAGAVWVGTLLASAGYGYLKVSECKEAEASLMARQQSQTYAPRLTIAPPAAPAPVAPGPAAPGATDPGATAPATVAPPQPYVPPTPPPPWVYSYPVPPAWQPPPPPEPPPPPPPPPPPSMEHPRPVFGANLGLHTLFNTPATQTRLVPFWNLRLGVNVGSMQVDLFGEYGSGSGYASRAVGLLGLVPLTATDPNQRLDFQIGGAVKYVDLSWAGPRVSGVAVQPTFAMRIATGWRMRLRLDLAYEIQLFKQESLQLLVPNASSNGFAHGPRLSVGVEF